MQKTSAKPVVRRLETTHLKPHRNKTLSLLAGAACALFLAQAGDVRLVSDAMADEAEVERLMAGYEAFKPNLAPIVLDRGDNLAFTEASDTIHPEQTAFARQMQRGIYMPVEDKVYVAVGYGITSTTMVVGDDGVIIIDPGENDDFGALVMEEFRSLTDKPIKAIVYTHRHPDHPFGSKGLGVTEEDVKSGKVKIYAHDSFMEYLVNDASVVGPILSIRTALASTLLDVGPEGRVHQALGPTFDSGPVSLLQPTDTFDEMLDVTIAGVRMVMFHAYGDAEDEIGVWFPEMKHLHGSETIQGESFPNIYTLRGTKFRDPVEWYTGVDRLLEYAREADSYSGSHMRPWVGNEFIVERITNYRDAIQYVHDQTVRLMNMGYTREELADTIRLPEHLANDPWLGEYYGTVAHSTRNIYGGYLGWYQADPTELATPGFEKKAALYVEALGGRDAILDKARKALDEGEYGWSMELLTHAVRVDGEDMEARAMKAEAMREWAYQQPNIYWRGLALGGALELEDKLDYSRIWNFAAPDIIKALSPDAIIESVRVRLDPEKAADAHMTIGFRFTDIHDDSALEIRRGVAVFHPKSPEKTDATIVATKALLDDILLEQTTLADALAEGSLTIEGDEKAIERFFGYLDTPSADPIKLVVR